MKRLHVAMVGAVLLLMVGLSPRLRVYHEVMVVEVTLVRVVLTEAGEERVTLPTPQALRRLGSGYWREPVLPQAEARIDASLAATRLLERSPAGMRYEFWVAWGMNQAEPETHAVIVREVSDGG